jgi:hypothetical protein
MSNEPNLEHPDLHTEITPTIAFENLEWFLSKHKLSWKAGEDQRKFHLILLQALWTHYSAERARADALEAKLADEHTRNRELGKALLRLVNTSRPTIEKRYVSIVEDVELDISLPEDELKAFDEALDHAARLLGIELRWPDYD